MVFALCSARNAALSVDIRDRRDYRESCQKRYDLMLKAQLSRNFYGAFHLNSVHFFQAELPRKRLFGICGHRDTCGARRHTGFVIDGSRL